MGKSILGGWGSSILYYCLTQLEWCPNYPLINTIANSKASGSASHTEQSSVFSQTCIAFIMEYTLWVYYMKFVHQG